MFKSFKDQYLKTPLAFDKIHDWVDVWHKSSSALSLQEYLGLTDAEMAMFVKGDNSLKKELDALKQHSSVASFSEKIESHYK